MLIFGLSVKEVLLATLVFVCETCGNNAAHHLVRRVRRFTLFFVPLFPVGSHYYDTCVACGRVREVSREQAEAAAAQTSGELR
ncbi:MAG: zinc-ribbon domain-containing protein [Propionibacteriaceae bacterium]